jgi:putative membrane protein
MQDTLAMTYYWLKAGHIIFMVFWMAGLFLLPRMFVYHQEAEPGAPENAQWIERERKLIRIILTPSIIVVWGLGLALSLAIDAWSQGWFYAKLALVIALSIYHSYLTWYAEQLAKGERKLTGRNLRLLNEVPGIGVALIVILVVIKPF